MTRKPMTWFLAAALVVLVGGAPALARKKPKDAPEAAPPDPAASQIETPTGDVAADGLAVWEGEAFRKSFLGSYGFNAEVEPRVTAVEREQMEEILPLLSSDPDAAVAALEAALAPGASAVFDFTLANLYFQRGDLDTAAGHYQVAVQKFPSFRRAHKNLGIIQVRTGKYEDAIGSLSRVIELGGADGLSYGLLGYAYSATGQYVPSESAYRAAALLEGDVLDWKLGLTQSVLKQRKYAEAITLTDELIARDPQRPDYWLLQANAWIGLKEPMKAAENFEIVRRMGKATPASLQTLGDIYTNESLWDLAVDAYAAAMQADPEAGVEGSLRAVEILAQRGALEQARTLLAAVKGGAGAGLGADERKKMLKLEARMAVAEGNGGEAVGVLEEIVALDPLDGEALLLLGQHYARADDPERAIFYYERAQSLQDFEADAAVRHAQLLVGESRYDEAVPLLKRAQELEPRDDVSRYLEQVERIARARR